MKNFDFELYAIVGLIGQAVFMGRFLVQWIATERARKTTVPLAFWICSITGSILLLIYGWLDGDIVILLGQSFGFVVYFRNLYYIRQEYLRNKARRRALRRKRKRLHRELKHRSKERGREEDGQSFGQPSPLPPMPQTPKSQIVEKARAGTPK
ncbi:MAG: lipid-A-disaccharide synthase N-terminal domain-containing protein [Sumerlaeia bacterium]